MRAGLGDGTRVTEVAVDGSNDDPNSFCNFPRIDSFADVPVATDLLQRPLFCFTNLTSQMPAGINKNKRINMQDDFQRTKKGAGNMQHR